MNVNMYRVTDSGNDPSVSPATWVVENDWGAIIDTTGTQTQGLQEAINYAAEHGHDLRVHGGGIARKNGQDVAIIVCTVPIVIPPVQGVDWHIHASIVFGGTPYPVAIQFDSAMNSVFKITGQIVCPPGWGCGVQIKPRNLLPNDTFAGRVVTACRFDISSVVLLGDLGTCIDLDATQGAITGNMFRFLEPNRGSNGIRVKAGATTCFDHNDIVALEVHGQTTGINSGCTAAGSALVYGNTWSVKIFPRGGSCGVELWSHHDRWIVSVGNREGAVVCGITLNPTAHSNLIDILLNQAQLPVNNASPHFNDIRP